jgi:flagellar biosynthetic protein FliQ
MTAEGVLLILRESLLLILLLSAPVMAVTMVVGLVVSLLQATTQIQEQTLSYVPKLVAAFLTLAITGPWILQHAVQFSAALFETIPTIR